mgnify:CR=1 FL=1
MLRPRCALDGCNYPPSWWLFTLETGWHRVCATHLHTVRRAMTVLDEIPFLFKTPRSQADFNNTEEVY